MSFSDFVYIHYIVSMGAKPHPFGFSAVQGNVLHPSILAGMIMKHQHV